ncbi:ubiquitin-like-specific protease 1D [Mercurialis annua]|uniref:ubiquitin-like-specific protease 1D n=1 Tax=Mercurialis annua TaxID=3986 RepID=UPI002160B4C6|nr:ubiquitin-like-specific protease 1D [Mercurialis annua]
MEGENQKKRPLELDWTQVLDQNDTEPPPPLLIVKTLPPQPSDNSPRDESCRAMTNHELDEAIKRSRSNLLVIGPKLPDGGEKFRALIKSYVEEKQRRLKYQRPETDVEICEKPSHLSSSSKTDGFKRENGTSSEVRPQSEFAFSFSKKMEEKTDSRIVNAFGKELQTLGRCKRQKTRFNGTFSQRGRSKGQSSSRKLPFKSAISLSHNGDKYASNGNLKGRASTNPFSRSWGSESINFPKKNVDCQVLPLSGSRLRKEQTVVLLDEDENPLEDMVDQEDKLPECMKDAKIYYPSRDDQGCVDICYADMDSLAPKSFLTSPIMNFYIRYLWLHTSPTNKAISDYHFFNTFFYSKLKQAVSYKGNDRESYFIKFRRWWKGVNIFQKAYVLIPIHEDLHWSLVIICIPDEKDESGPIILHLDSLRFHSSETVFEDITSYLREEWRYMRKEVSPLDVPIAKRVWEYLPRRIETRKTQVPQQKNDYDCGLFVLFFMERFIEEAPERLKKKDLAMFGKQWFRHEEASGLRIKIKRLLLDEFKKANESGCVSESPRLSTGIEQPPDTDPAVTTELCDGSRSPSV